MNIRISDYKKIIFLRQLALIYDSDIFSTDGLELLKKTEKDEALKSFYEELLNQLSMGSPLSFALESTCDFFEPYELKLIELGEQTGKISTVLNDMANGIERERIIQEKISASFRYPKVLSLLTLFVLLIIIAVIVPVYHDLIVSSGAPGDEIGVMMVGLNAFGLFLRAYAWQAFIAAVFLIAAWKFFKKTKAGVDFSSKYSLRAVLTKKINLQASGIFFVKNLAMLLDSGIDFLMAFEILLKAEKNPQVKAEISRATEVLREKESFREAMQTFTLFPDVLHEILNVAVSTGHIVPSLKKIEQTMHIELNKNIDRTISLIEPVITIVISLMVGLVLISGILPVFKILSKML